MQNLQLDYLHYRLANNITRFKKKIFKLKNITKTNKAIFLETV